MENLAIDQVAVAFCLATKNTLEKGIGHEVNYVKTIQSIPRVSIRPDIGCFVQFSGDYNGLVALTFSADAALYLYRNYMITMGLPAEELVSDATSAEVADTIGEITNQIMGRTMRMVEAKYDLNAYFGQPKALSLNNGISLVPEASNSNTMASDEASVFDNRRIVFKLEDSRFYLEIAMERIEFIKVE
jgi:CheY-specific phosphatase CheX